MNQPSHDTISELAPDHRAVRLAARLKDKCLRSGGTGAALHETAMLDSGALTALPRLSADLHHLQEHDPLPADPLRPFTAGQTPGGTGGRRWSLGRKKQATAPAPVLSGAQWQAWQEEVKQTGERLAHQWRQLSTLQVRQEQLLADLQTDARILTRAAELLLADSDLPPLWREELAQAMKERALDVQNALGVARQLGGAVRLLLGNHTLMQGRLLTATQLLLYAAQTGTGLQQALNAQLGLNTLPEMRLAPVDTSTAAPNASSADRIPRKDQE
ncbi:hypothetical protein [Deinococcus altitudinis]|uniref:hypothetical protein n=1 Tax=Deinococcus altitudinis TaxID=468914 RepID=UPI003891F860